VGEKGSSVEKRRMINEKGRERDKDGERPVVDN
jgi:hypothetical protein